MSGGDASVSSTFDLDDPGLLFRVDVLDDPAPLYAHLRQHAPVWELPGSGTFVVSTAELVAEAVRYYLARHRPEDWEEYVKQEVAWSRRHAG